MSTGNESVESQTQFYEWLFERQPQEIESISWPLLAPIWDVALEVAEIYETEAQPDRSNDDYMKLYAKAPALIYHLSDWSPNLNDAVFGLAIARYYSGTLSGGTDTETAVLTSLSGVFQRYLAQQKGSNPISFFIYLSESDPDHYGKVE